MGTKRNFKKVANLIPFFFFFKIGGSFVEILKLWNVFDYQNDFLLSS